MTVVCKNDAAHGVEKHLQHGLGPETRSNDVGDAIRMPGLATGDCQGTGIGRGIRLRSSDVGHLGLTTNLSLTTAGVYRPKVSFLVIFCRDPPAGEG